MTEYTNITKDYVIRSIKNYLIAKDLVEYPFTLALETLHVVSVAISEEKDSHHLINTIKKKDSSKELKNITFFNTDDDYNQCFKNLRDGVSHLCENYDYLNKSTDLNKFRFTCNKMQKECADITEKELDLFLKQLFTIIQLS